jgi:hypothetical protein
MAPAGTGRAVKLGRGEAGDRVPGAPRGVARAPGKASGRSTQAGVLQLLVD